MATVQYDDILLNIGSRASTDGIDKSISMLKQLKEIFPIGGIKESADAMKEFASAINSMDKGVVSALSKIKGNLTQVASAAKKAKSELGGESGGFRSDITDAVQREMERLRSMREGGNYVAPEEYWNPDKVAEDYARASEELEKINANVGEAANEASRFDENVKQLVEDLYNAPPTTNSFLKLQGYSQEEIITAKQEVANMKWEEQQAAKAAKEAAKATKEIGDEAEKAKSPLQKLADRFGNIIRYRLMRSIITGTVQAVKEGFKNLEEWDRAKGNTGFADSMDRARESLEVLKNSLAVMSAPFLEWLISLLEKAARWVMNVANGISRLIAILSGKSTYRAVQWAEYGSQAAAGFSSATEAAKEFKRQLMGFDEINNLTAPGNGGGGSGGGSGGGFSYTDMFTESPVGDLSKFEEWLQRAGEAWRQGCEELSSRFSNAWRKIKQKLGNLKLKWQGFVEEVKGLKERDWGEWWDEFAKESEMDKVGQWWEELGKSASDFGTRLKAVFTAFKLWINGDAEGALKVLEKAFDNTKQKAKGDFDEIHSHAQKRLGGIGSYAESEFQKVVDESHEMVEGVNKNLSKKMKLKVDTSALDNAVEKTKQAVQNISTSLAPKFHINIEGKLELNEVDISGLGSSYFKIVKFANGGMPNTGSLFIARESGPEMVGTIGGSTAVANNDDIVAAVSQGVASAVASVLGGGTNVNVVLEGDAGKLFRVVQSQARNYAIQTGSYAFG